MTFSGYTVVTAQGSKITGNHTDFPVLVRSSVGVVNTVTTAVTWVSGDKFPLGIVGTGILINGVAYVVSSRTTDSALVLGSSAGSQTGVAYCSTPDLRDVAHGGYVQSASGYDIWAYSDAPPSTRIPIEREFYDPATGNYIGWAKRTLATSTDAGITLAYGDSGITTDAGTNGDATYGATSVWDTNYKGVWHMNQTGTVTTWADSTGNANGTNSGATATSGKVDGAANFNSTSDAMTLNTTLLTAGDAYTVEWWESINSNTNTYPARFALAINGSVDTFLVLRGKGDGYDSLTWGPTNKSSENRSSAAPSTATTGWHHWVLAGSTPTGRLGSGLLYVDGVSYAVISGNAYGSLSRNQIGWDGADNGADAKMDEIRVSSGIARSADWNLDEYSNQYDPGTFESWGARQVIGGGASAADYGIIVGGYNRMGQQGPTIGGMM